MMMTASVFKNGSSQAVRIPKEFRFEGERVKIKKLGNCILLIPIGSTWDSLINSLDKFSDDFMSERNQPEAQEREGLFE